MKIYGLKNCDKCRKALKELNNFGFEAVLHDLRAEPLPVGVYRRFFAELGMEMINRKSKTWRDLPESARNLPPVDLACLYPAVVKRPVIERDAGLLLGWNATVFAQITGQN